jgi:hypothetical protein
LTAAGCGLAGAVVDLAFFVFISWLAGAVVDLGSFDAASVSFEALLEALLFAFSSPIAKSFRWLLEPEGSGGFDDFGFGVTAIWSLFHWTL